jgi:hypothetical protein
VPRLNNKGLSHEGRAMSLCEHRVEGVATALSPLLLPCRCVKHCVIPRGSGAAAERQRPVSMSCRPHHRIHQNLLIWHAVSGPVSPPHQSTVHASDTALPRKLPSGCLQQTFAVHGLFAATGVQFLRPSAPLLVPLSNLAQLVNGRPSSVPWCAACPACGSSPSGAGCQMLQHSSW